VLVDMWAAQCPLCHPPHGRLLVPVGVGGWGGCVGMGVWVVALIRRARKSRGCWVLALVGVDVQHY
jgi:hypothetical protein